MFTYFWAPDDPDFLADCLAYVPLDTTEFNFQWYRDENGDVCIIDPGY